MASPILESPGSFIDFTAQHGVDPSSSEALAKHSQAPQTYRERLAAERNISVDELHVLVGNIGIGSVEA